MKDPDLWITCISLVLCAMIVVGVVWLFGPYGLIGSGVAGLVSMFIGLRWWERG